MGSTNYLKGSGQFTEESPLIRNASDVGHMYDSYAYHNGVLTATIPTEGTYTWILNADGIPAGHQTSGTVASSRLFSMWLNNESTGNHYSWSNYGIGPDGRAYGSITIPAGTYTVRTNLYAADNVNYTVKFWNMKIIQGNYNPNDTWCPHKEDELYNVLCVDSELGYDATGHENTLTQAGTIPIVSNSARYGSCIDFNQTGYLKKTDFNMTTHEFTITFWLNPPYSINAQHFVCGTFNNWTGNGFGMWRDSTGGGYSSLYKSTGEGSHTGLPLLDVTHDAWNHIAYVYTGRQGIIYKNGVEVARKDGGSGGAVFHPVLYLGNSRYNEIASQTDEASMSDFRFYATALSATDISDLYKNAASIAKNGEFFAYDFHENARNTVDKNGIVASGGFHNKVAPVSDMRLTTLEDDSTWARIHYLDVTKD
jgi:hypothetical protein